MNGGPILAIVSRRVFDGGDNNLCFENSAGSFVNVTTTSQVNPRKLMPEIL